LEMSNLRGVIEIRQSDWTRAFHFGLIFPKSMKIGKNENWGLADEIFQIF